MFAPALSALFALATTAPAAPWARATMEPAEGTFQVSTRHDFTLAVELRQALPVGSELRILTPRDGGWSRPSLDPAKEEQPGGFALVRWRLERAADPAAKLTGQPEKYSDRGPPYTAQDVTTSVRLTVEGASLAAGDKVVAEFPNCRVTGRAPHRDPARNVTGYRLQLKPAGADDWTEVDGLPQYRIKPGPPKFVQLKGPSQVVRGEPLRLTVTVLDGRDGNPVHDWAGKLTLTCTDAEAKLPETVELTAADVGNKAVEGVVLGSPGRQVITLSGGAAVPGAADHRCLVEVLGQAPPLRLYWAELHDHGMLSYDARNWGGCTMRPADQHWYARWIQNLDVCGLTDHSMHNGRLTQQNMTESEYLEIRAAGREANDPGRFVAITAVEHRCARGDTNTYFLTDDQPFYMKDKLLTVQELWRFFRDVDVITIPHLHPMVNKPERFDDIDPTKERLIEIHSNHGRYEFFGNQPLIPGKGMVKGNTVQDILARGHRLGVVAASDDHSGRPGMRDLTGIYATARTREAVFAAMQARHTFGTTGPRMNVELKLGDLMMGDEAKVAQGDAMWQARRFTARVAATQKLQHLEVVRNGKVIYSVDPEGDSAEFEYLDQTPLDQCWLGTEKNHPPTAYYYLRVTQNPDRPGTPVDMAWTSPIFLSPGG